MAAKLSCVYGYHALYIFVFFVNSCIGFAQQKDPQRGTKVSSSCSNVKSPFCNLQSEIQSVHKWIGNSCKSNFKLCEKVEVMDGPRINLDATRHHIEIPCSKGNLGPKGKGNNASGLLPQSGMQRSGGTTSDNNIIRMSGQSTEENVMFSQQVPSYMYEMDSTIDPTRKLQDSNDATLEHFFSRPLKIHEAEWSTSTSLAFDIDPWSLYFENPRVINRIINFSLLRAKLHVRIVVNGNGFQYGRALASYLPLDGFDTMSSNAALVPQDLVQASQQPHIFINPTTSSGGDMILPFFHHKNYLQITQSEWNEMGRLYVRSINDLKHANGASDVVTISVFAWAEEVSMSVLTSVEPGTLIPQSGREIDEVNMKGFVSGPATAIAKAAKAMSSIPVIRPYAMATEVVASATAAVAKQFGYCRPPITKEAEPYRPTACSSLAVTNVGDNTQKLTVDNKQELSIDPRIAGLGGTDPMSINQIAKRESYLTQFTWAIGSAPETILWNSRVAPVTWAESTVTGDTAYHLPACAMAALPFDYWTGTMKFRFQVVASAFHKGRLKIVYDPNFINTNEYNTNYVTIVDIADKQDFTIEVGNGQSTTLLEHMYPGVDSATEMYSTSRYSSKEVGNGVLAVYIVNELTTPNSSVNNDIAINVYVSMGDDFEVFVPNDRFAYYTFKPQSGFEPQSGKAIAPESMNTEEPDAPQQEMSISMGPDEQDTSDINKVFTGESIQSFRTLLKRYNLWRAMGLYDTTYTLNYGTLKMFPYLRGNVSGAVDTTSLGDPYSYCNTVLLHWIVAAFSGWRGSVRWKFLLVGGKAASAETTLFIERVPKERSATYNTATTAGWSAPNAKTAARNVVVSTPLGMGTSGPPMGAGGSMYTISAVNPTAEFEIPFYSNNRFVPGKVQNYTTLASTDQNTEAFDYAWNGTGNASTLYQQYVAAGEDFQVYFFTGMPRLYYETGPPA